MAVIQLYEVECDSCTLHSPTTKPGAASALFWAQEDGWGLYPSAIDGLESIHLCPDCRKIMESKDDNTNNESDNDNG